MSAFTKSTPSQKTVSTPALRADNSAKQIVFLDELSVVPTRLSKAIKKARNR